MMCCSRVLRKALFGLGVVVGLAISVQPPRTHAEDSSRNVAKISPDLRRSLLNRSSSERQRLIVQFKEKPTPALDTLLMMYGATIQKKLDALNLRIVQLPPSAIASLAARAEVRYISPDRPLALMGHVETTTGTADVRTQTTTSLGGLLSTTTTFDGRDIGIAIVDSGIDTRHVAFRNELGFSRVILSKDFTGEGRTDDPSGHGTE